MSGKAKAVTFATLLASGLFASGLVGCAKANTGTETDGGHGGSAMADADLTDATCGNMCDHDHDGVIDPNDMCANTPAGQMVNHEGCADSQLTPTLVEFPPFGLTWTPTGDLGRAAGLTWTYVGINRTDLFHIYWIVCDDPATPCGLSLDGAIDVATEHWSFDSTNSDLPMGKLVFTNATHILLADNSTPLLNGRLTINIVDAATTPMPIPFADVATLKVTPRDGTHGAEITGIAFTVTAKSEVQVPGDTTWTPYLDYYDAAPTPTAGGSVTTSFGGSFYAK